MPWYEYSSIAGGGARLPLVEVVLWNGSRRVRLVALVDSGADVSTFDASYAQALGLDRGDADTGDLTTAGGGTVTGLRWPQAPLEMQFEGDRFAFEGVFIEFPPNADPMNLIGRQDFFKRYIIQFWETAELMSIDASPDFPRAIGGRI